MATGPLADFQTFNFDVKLWTGPMRVKIPTSGWSLDNLVVIIPEPSSSSLFLVGGLAFLLLHAYRNRQWSKKSL